MTSLFGSFRVRPSFPTRRSSDLSFEVFAQAAVDDPNVIAMKTAVYRTSDDSALVGALIQCAEDGKQSVCLVELKARSEEHTSELQSPCNLVCRLLLEKKNEYKKT